MSKLTPKQERFAQCVANGMTQADAYRTAFSVSPTTKPETIQKRASELMAGGVVPGRVKFLRDELSSLALWTRADSVTVLAGIAGDKEFRAGDRVSAVKELNAMHGWNKPESEGTDDMSLVLSKLIDRLPS